MVGMFCRPTSQITRKSIGSELYSGLKCLSFLGKFGDCDVKLLTSIYIGFYLLFYTLDSMTDYKLQRVL